MDLLIVLEIKLDSSLSQSQFIIEGYAPLFRYDINSHGGDILLFIREDTSPLKDFEGIFVELNARKKIFLLYCSYKPHKLYHNLSILSIIY